MAEAKENTMRFKVRSRNARHRRCGIGFTPEPVELMLVAKKRKAGAATEVTEAELKMLYADPLLIVQPVEPPAKEPAAKEPAGESAAEPRK